MAKRKDNTAKFMRGLKKATQETLTEAAQKLQLISQQLVSRKFTGRVRKHTPKNKTIGTEQIAIGLQLQRELAMRKIEEAGRK